IVHADNARAGGEGDRYLVAIVRLHERVEPERRRAREKRRQLAGPKRGDDEQHRIGAGGLRLQELILRDDEVFAQQRRVDRRSNRRQVLDGPVEERRLGQHRNGRGSRVDISPCDRHRIVLRAQNAARRRSPLALGDDVHPIEPGQRGQQTFSAAPDAIRPPGQRREWFARLADLHDPPRRRHDRREQITRRLPTGDLRRATAHAPAPTANSSAVETDTRRSSVRRASPRSIARDARRMPSSTDAASPAMKSDTPAFKSTMSRGAPRSPASTLSIIRAFWWASPPLSDPSDALGSPTSAGCK